MGSDTLQAVEAFELILKDSLSRLLHEIDERLQRQQRLLEVSVKNCLELQPAMRSGEAPEIPDSPAFRPGTEMVLAQPCYEEVASRLPQAQQPQASASLGAAPLVVSFQDPSQNNTQESSELSAPQESRPRTTRSGSLRHPKLAKQNSYELAKQADAKAGDGDWIRSEVDQANNSAEHEKGRHAFYQLMSKIVKTWYFEAFFAVLIFAHAILLGVQIDWECQNLTTELPSELHNIHIAFTAMFCLEIVMRVAALGWREFFTGQAYVWNLIDVFLVPWQCSYALL
eukprot:Skav209782  [mRNA]  locus=scaffold9:609675:611687:- [translate_table: standard]